VQGEQHPRRVLKHDRGDAVLFLLDQHALEAEDALIPVAAELQVPGGQAHMVEPQDLGHSPDPRRTVEDGMTPK